MTHSRFPVAGTLIGSVFVLMLACNTRTSEPKNATADSASATMTDADGNPINTSDYESEYREWDTVAYEELRNRLPAFDLNQDLSSKSLEELRILRNTIPARYGYLFMSADLRYYFYNTDWYRGLMEARWYGDCEESGLKKAPPIEYTRDENAFLERVKKLETQKLSQNYIVRDGKRYANVNNIINTWQYGKLPGELIKGLDRNGFAIVPNQNVQLFHVYEQNDYSQTQNFISTDLYLQLFHMHFSFMLRGLEENEFVPLIGQLLYGLQKDANELAIRSADAPTKGVAEYAAAFYTIPLRILGAETVNAPTSYRQIVKNELDNIENGVASPSSLLREYKNVEFPYDLFQPRGHYTRTDTLKRYFKTMQWLQNASLCLESDTDLRQAIVQAYLLNTGRSASGKSLLSLYQAILEPISFLIGKPDNVSLLDLCNLITAKNATSLASLLEPANVSYFQSELKKIEASKNVIKPKIEVTCRGKINFMPSRFVLDSEILQEMTDLDERPYPKGLDVMASFGSKAAEDILVKELGETNTWSKFLPQLEKMKAKYGNYEQWDETVYAKWIKSLSAMLKPDASYPSFMQLPSWNKKNLNTALASWAELKHDAILYTEQPMGAECGGGGDCAPPPEPYVVGYVEPNVNYWKEALDLLRVTKELMSKHDLFENFSGDHSQLEDMCRFFLTVSEKEVRGEKLSPQEYNTIELIGTNVERLTLSIFGTYEWSAISGPDKEVAVVADVYTNNQGEKAGILHAAVGYVNDLYVVVEIEGYLYLTKGGTFSYYEFPMPLDKRLTDEEWQEALKKGKVYPVPPWMKEVIINLDKTVQPEVKEFLYSSGC